MMLTAGEFSGSRSKFGAESMPVWAGKEGETPTRKPKLSRRFTAGRRAPTLIIEQRRAVFCPSYANGLGFFAERAISGAGRTGSIPLGLRGEEVGWKSRVGSLQAI